MPVNTTLQVRRGSGENWNSVNPTLSNGELGLNIDNGLFKIGDGLTAWTSLPYYPGIPLSSGTGIGFVEHKDSNNVITGITVFNALKAGSNIELSLSGNDIVIAGSSPTTVSQGTGIVVVQVGDDYEVNLDNEHVRDLIGGVVGGNSGIGVNVDDANDTITFSVTGILSSQITDFNSAVDARVTAGSISDESIRDIVSTGLNGGTGIYIEYDDDGTDLININVTGVSFSGHTHDDRYYTETELNTSGAGGQVHWSNITNKPTGFTPVAHIHTAADITDFTEASQDVVGGMIVAGTGVSVSYNDDGNTLTIHTSGYALTSHTHEWSEITDASTKATLTELGYLSGVTPGTVSAERVLVVDANKDLASLRDFSATGSVTLGSVSANTVNTSSDVNVGGALIVAGNLTISGTTTTVNSTTVDIGDNIIQMNVSGSATQGGIQVLDHDSSDTLKLVWDNVDNRWEFEGGTANVYTTGSVTAASFNGSLDWSNIVGDLPDPIITGTLTGDITGTSSVTLTNLGNGLLTISTTLADNTVTSAKIVDGTIVNADISNSAAIAVTKLANSGVTLGSTVVNLGQTSTVIDGLTRISGVSAGNPVYLYYAVIDGGSP